MSDITKRLVRQHERTGLEYLREAADEIERLRERIEELEGRINAAGGDNLERNIEMLRDRGAKLTAQDKRIEELTKENKRVNDLAQELNAELLEERLQKTHEYAETNDMLRERIEELEKERNLYGKIVEINGWPDISETHVVTHKQIDAAWAFVVDPPGYLSQDVKDAVEAALGAFGIERCEEERDGEKCIDGYLYGVRCPGCGGHGWVKGVGRQ